MSRRSARNRPRQRAAKAAIPDYRRIADLESQLGMISSVLPEDLRQQLSKAAPPGSVSFSPAQLSAMLAAQQQLQSGNMTAQPLPQSPYWDTAPFGPGRRLPPAPINTVRPDTGRAEPRLWEFPVSWNLQIDDRWHVPWRTLQHAADMPLFRKCIERRKSVCGLDFTVTVDPKAVARAAALSGSATKDVESELRKQYMSEISRITDWLQEPDPKNGLDWQAWTSLLMENQLKFGASVVYPRKTFGGDLFALEVIDSKTIKPLLDEYGGRPAPPQPAYQQIMYGFPRGEFIADADVGMDGKPFVPGGFSSDELVYERRMLRSESPYGLSATEIALLDGLVWMRRMGWILSEYTEGVTPGGLVETDPATGWDVGQWEDFSRSFNNMLEGDTAARQKWPFMPPGTKMIQPQTIPEQYKPDYDLFLIKLVAGDFGLPASEVGFTETGALGASFHEGEEDILNRQTRIPDADWLSKIATKLCKRQLRMPGVLQVQILGLESEDEAAADAVAAEQVSGARLTVNEDRARRGLPTYTFPEADMPMLTTPRGVVFLDGASKLGPPGTLIGPAVAAADGSAEAGTVSGNGRQIPLSAGQAEPSEQDGEDEQDGPPSKTAEKAALRRYLAKDRSRPFECRALTAADVPALAGDPRVLFKDGDAGPKDPSSSADRAPEAASDDVADGVPVNAVLTREHADTLSGDGTAADVTDHLVGELDRLVRAGEVAIADAFRLGAVDQLRRTPADGPGESLRAAEVGSGSPLGHLVHSVGPVASKEQVVRPDAGRVVAGVADVEPIGDGAVGELPGDAVGAGGGALGAAKVAASKAEDAVVPVVGVAGGHPLPAVAGHVDLGPEAALKDGSHQVSVPKAWPGWERDQELVALYADRIRTALTDSVDTTKLAEAWQALHPEAVSKAITPVLSQFLDRASRAIRAALAGVLPNAWTEGWVLGQASAHALVNGGEVDWGAWKPGDHRAAAAIAGPGLQTLLAERDIRIKSIAATRLQDLADVLEATLASDVTHRQPLPAPLEPSLSVGDLARQLRDVLDRPDRAELVATTEIARAQAEASRTVYRETGRTEVEISTAEDDKVCPLCDAAQAEGAHPLGQPPMVPLHPRCRCAELPVLVGA